MLRHRRIYFQSIGKGEQDYVPCEICGRPMDHVHHIDERGMGGDPTGSGMGGPGYNIKLEISKWMHEEGTLSMARAQDPDSNGSQFFITHRATPHLDRKYSAFGWVLEGQDIVNSIAVGDKMTKVEILKKRTHEYKPEIVRGELPFEKETETTGQ